MGIVRSCVALTRPLPSLALLTPICERMALRGCMCVPLYIHPPRGLSHFLGRGALALVPDPPLHLPSREVDTFPRAVHLTEWALQEPGPSAGTL